MPRERFKRVNEPQLGEQVWIDFPPAPDTLMTVFDMDVRIECDQGDELQTIEHIRTWVNRDVLSKAPKEESKIETEEDENFIG